MIYSCYRECRVQYGKYFPVFSYFTSLVSEIITKYEKREKYFPILHKTKCDNYIIVRYMLRSNMQELSSYLITNCFEFLFPCFNSIILYSVYLFCIQWSFAVDLFWNNLFQIFYYDWKHMSTELLILLCWHILHQIFILWSCRGHKFRD